MQVRRAEDQILVVEELSIKQENRQEDLGSTLLIISRHKRHMNSETLDFNNEQLVLLQVRKELSVQVRQLCRVCWDGLYGIVAFH